MATRQIQKNKKREGNTKETCNVNIQFRNPEYTILERTAALGKESVEELCTFIIGERIKPSLSGGELGELAGYIWTTSLTAPESKPIVGPRVSAEFKLNHQDADIFHELHELIQHYLPSFYHDTVVTDAANGYLDYLADEGCDEQAIQELRIAWRQLTGQGA